MNYKVGETVSVRMFNTPENKFYGPIRTAKIVQIDKNNYSPSGAVLRPYKVKYIDTGFEGWIASNEIKGRL